MMIIFLYSVVFTLKTSILIHRLWMSHTKTISYWDGKQIISPAFFKNIR